jgi:hypothetical protein
MSYRLKTILPIFGMFLLFGYVALAMVRSAGQEIKQPLPPSLDNLAAIKLVEIRDAGGQIILSGNFSITTAKDGDIEAESPLIATAVDADAAGEAEIEVATRNGSVEKELEVEVRNLDPGATFKLFIDGRQEAVITTDFRGAAELEMSNGPSS